MKQNREKWLRAYGSVERVRWIHERPCIVCGRKPSENAHVRSGGMGRKADAKWIVPLCFNHHNEQHSRGAKTFEQTYGVDLAVEAEAIEKRWQRVLSEEVG